MKLTRKERIELILDNTPRQEIADKIINEVVLPKEKQHEKEFDIARQKIRMMKEGIENIKCDGMCGNTINGKLETCTRCEMLSKL